jgi:hypothetical protein
MSIALLAFRKSVSFSDSKPEGKEIVQRAELLILKIRGWHLSTSPSLQVLGFGGAGLRTLN